MIDFYFNRIEAGMGTNAGQTRSSIVGILDNRAANIASTEIVGLDARLSNEFNVGGGVLSSSFDLSYFFKYANSGVSAESGETSIVGTAFNPRRFRSRMSLFWKGRAVSLGGFLNYTSGGSNNTVIPEEKIDGWLTTDISASLNFEQLAPESRVLRGLVARLGVVNIFNEDPPFVRFRFPTFPINMDATNSNPFGRVVTFEIIKRW